MANLTNWALDATEDARTTAAPAHPAIQRLFAALRLLRRRHRRHALYRAMLNETRDPACLADFGIAARHGTAGDRALAKTVGGPWTNG